MDRWVFVPPFSSPAPSQSNKRTKKQYSDLHYTSSHYRLFTSNVTFWSFFHQKKKLSKTTGESSILNTWKIHIAILGGKYLFTLISSMKLFFILDLEKVRWTYYLLKMSHFVGGIRNKGRLVVQHRGTSFFMSWWMTLKRKVLSFYFYVWFFDVYFGYFLLFFGLSVNVDNRLFIHSTFKHLSRSKDFF